jgi:hypothetical protein
MILTNLTIYLAPTGSSPKEIEYSYSLMKRSRHILNFVERTCLRKIKYETNGFKGIVIDKIYNEAGEPYITLNKSLAVPLKFDKLKYDEIKTVDEFRKYVEECVKKALEKIKGLYDVPSAEILESLQTLKENNYVNEWLHKEKTDRKRKIAVALTCSITIEKFQLRLIVKVENKEVFDGIVLETDPDEVAFHYLFKDIRIEEDKIIITSKLSTNLLEYSLKNHSIKMLN